MNRLFLVVLASALLGGCAAGTPKPPLQPAMSLDDPTNANAVEAPLPSPTTTLNAETSADTQPSPTPTGAMPMRGESDQMKGMDMKQDGSMPDMRNQPTSGRSQ